MQLFNQNCESDGRTLRLPQRVEEKIKAFACALVDQENCRVIVSPQGEEEGFWFGGGNVVCGPDGRLYLCGRYRNPGDSRHGVGKGERGLELAVFVSEDNGLSFKKLLSFSKKDLSTLNEEVVSIEGASLLFCSDHVEMYISTERTGRSYPPMLSSYQKPGTGVWSIHLLKAATIDELKNSSLINVVAPDNPLYLHAKDPAVFRCGNEDTFLFFCTHPFTWASSNTALTVRKAGEENFGVPHYNVFARGAAWDVAITRTTGLLDLPAVGDLAEQPLVSLIFYDGGECLRNLSQHSSAVTRPRGYSCEEIGGLGYVLDHDYSNIFRISEFEPLFISPWGTGSSRYLSTIAFNDQIFAFWEQSQKDCSQPLVAHSISMEQAVQLLS